MAKLLSINGRLAMVNGRLVTDEGGAPCCCGGGGGPQPCRYYPAVLCSRWLCEPAAMAEILPGDGVTVWLCVCPPQTAPIGQVFRIQTRCYRITGAPVDADSLVPDSDWLYTCDGQLIPPVGSILSPSQHRMHSVAGCDDGACRVDLCGKWVRLSPCGDSVPCPRPVFARADLYPYGRATPVLCAGVSPPRTVCYCAEATPDVLRIDQLPPVRQLVSTVGGYVDCCDCIDAGGDTGCEHQIIPGTSTTRTRSCCCPASTAITGVVATMRATFGDLRMEWEGVTFTRFYVPASDPQGEDLAGVRLSVFVRVTRPSTNATQRYGPIEIPLECGFGFRLRTSNLFPATQDPQLPLRSDGWLDPIGSVDGSVFGFIGGEQANWPLWVRQYARRCSELVGSESLPPQLIQNDFTLRVLGGTDQCEGCGSGDGPGDVGELIP